MELAFALGCPRCSFYAEVSEEDPDATLSYVLDHLFSNHAGYDRRRAMAMLAQVTELTEAEVSR